MKYGYQLLYEGTIKPGIKHNVELPNTSKIKSIMVETNLPKRTIVRFVGNGSEILLEIPIFYLKNLWFPLDIEAQTYSNLKLDFLNKSKLEKYFKIYIARKEL